LLSLYERTAELLNCRKSARDVEERQLLQKKGKATYQSESDQRAGQPLILHRAELQPETNKERNRGIGKWLDCPEHGKFPFKASSAASS
jgi:hypothetical protein